MTKVLFKEKEKPNYSWLKMKKAFEWNDLKWEEIPVKDFIERKISTLLDENARIMLEFHVHGMRVFVVSVDADIAKLKKKFPDAFVINVVQLLKMWTGVINDNYVFDVLPKVFLAFKYNPGAKITEVKNIL